MLKTMYLGWRRLATSENPLEEGAANQMRKAKASDVRGRCQQVMVAIVQQNERNVAS